MKASLTLAQDFVWRNARLLERQFFAYLFANGSRKAVLSALCAYQNADGGFGNALEPDKRCPTSQPVDVEFAFHVLDTLGNFDDAMVSRACGFLASITTREGGIPFALPSVMEYPRAPWWKADNNPPASLNPTASIVGLLLKHKVKHPWVDSATAFCWRAIAESDTRQFHDLMPMIAFLEYAPDRSQAERELNRIAERIVEPGMMTLETDVEGYVKYPLDWAPTPSSFCRRLFSTQVIETHLRALAARQQEDGGWPINWEAISPTVALEWRGIVTLRSLQVLRAYGALQN
jgi:hypothetical protein